MDSSLKQKLEAYEKWFGEPVPKDMQLKELPSDINGVSYGIYPVFLVADTDEQLEQFKKKAKWTLPKELDEDMVLDMVARDVISMARSFNRTSNTPLDLWAFYVPDIEEIQKNIHDFKSIPHSYFIGFIEAFQHLQLKVNGKTYYLGQNCPTDPLPEFTEDYRLSFKPTLCYLWKGHGFRVPTWISSASELIQSGKYFNACIGIKIANGGENSDDTDYELSESWIESECSKLD